jgi:hypothetical protein
VVIPVLTLSSAHLSPTLTTRSYEYLVWVGKRALSEQILSAVLKLSKAEHKVHNNAHLQSQKTCVVLRHMRPYSAVRVSNVIVVDWLETHLAPETLVLRRVPTRTVKDRAISFKPATLLELVH